MKNECFGHFDYSLTSPEYPKSSIFSASACHTIREDGTCVKAGENDNLIVHK